MKKIITDFQMSDDGITVLEIRLEPKGARAAYIRIEGGRISWAQGHTNLSKPHLSHCYHIRDLIEWDGVSPLEQVAPSLRTEIAVAKRSNKRVVKVLKDPIIKLGKTRKSKFKQVRKPKP